MDFYMNFKRFVWQDGHLDVGTKNVIGLAVSLTDRCPTWQAFFSRRVHSDADEIRAIVATCSMYNLAYKLAGDSVLAGMPVGLRCHAFEPLHREAIHLDAKTAELINFVVSTMNGCHRCMTGHIEESRRSGFSNDAMHEAIMCAATIHAACVFSNSL
jgi:alkyl hydroperoxide reductase subunit D